MNFFKHIFIGVSKVAELALRHSKELLQIGLGILFCATGGALVGASLIAWAVGNIAAPYTFKYIIDPIVQRNRLNLSQKNSLNLLQTDSLNTSQKKSLENTNRINANGKTLDSIEYAYEEQTKNKANKNDDGTLPVSFKTKEEEFDFFQKMARQGHDFTVKNSKGKIVGRATGGIYSKVGEANRRINPARLSRQKASVKPDDKSNNNVERTPHKHLNQYDLKNAINDLKESNSDNQNISSNKIANGM
jgi:hypothetical protein